MSIKRSTLIAFVALVTAGGLFRAYNIFVPGFAPDEEITWLSTRGIGQHFLPILPSGILYDRGIPYSYSAWFAGLFFGQSVETYRIVSFISGILAIVIVFFIGRKLLNHQTGLMAAAFLVFLPWAIVISEWARFYSLFLTSALITLFAYYLSRTALYLTFLALTCLLHESGIVLVLLPVFHLLSTTKSGMNSDKRKNLLRLSAFAACVVSGVFIGRGFLIAEPAREEYLNLYEQRAFMKPPVDYLQLRNLPAVLVIFSVGTACLWLFRKKNFSIPVLWSILALILSSILQLGLLTLLMILGSIFDPTKRKAFLITAIALSMISISIWTLQTIVHLGIFSLPERIVSIFSYAFAFPLGSLKYFALHWPLLSLIGVLSLSSSMNHPQTSEVREVLVGISLASITLISMLQVPLQPRYFLLPSLMLVLSASIWSATSTANKRWILSILVVGILASEQYVSLQESVLLRIKPTWFRPMALELRTFELGNQEGVLNLVQPQDVIISNDELATFYYFGRCHYWFLPQSHYFRRFGYENNGTFYGWYTGSRILATADELRMQIRKEPDKRFLLILLRTGKFGGHRNQILQDVRKVFASARVLYGTETGSSLLLVLNP